VDAYAVAESRNPVVELRRDVRHFIWLLQEHSKLPREVSDCSLTVEKMGAVVEPAVLRYGHDAKRRCRLLGRDKFTAKGYCRVRTKLRRSYKPLSGS
jgi:hypothetical protein